jgi:transcriptional regulator with XRE-family HTH domain
MAITAYFDREAAGDAPRAPRRTLRLETSGRHASGGETPVLVHNASTTGLLIETAAELAEGERIEIDLPHAGPVAAQIVWRSGKLFGSRFDSPVSAGTLAAAELRSVSGQPDIAPRQLPREASPASFGMRLQQLRKGRGLTLANLADALSVSKPTVWAWEHGKARPVESRLEGIAQALGVERDDLIPAGGQVVSGELIERCRSQIAEAAGLAPEAVRIFIEL